MIIGKLYTGVFKEGTNIMGYEGLEGVSSMRLTERESTWRHKGGLAALTLPFIVKKETWKVKDWFIEG